MKPDRSNYEIWFIDWLDGNLSREQTRELKKFLEENPDLQEELSDLSVTQLKPANRPFSGKKDLLRTFADFSDYNFENLCIANLENDLPEDQVAELNEIINRDEDKRKTFKLFQELRLHPPNEIYRGKNTLKKLTTGQRIIRLSIIGLSAAAAVSSMFIIPSLFKPGFVQNRDQISENSVKDTFNIAISSPLFYGEKSPVLESHKDYSGIIRHNVEVQIPAFPVLSDSLNETTEEQPANLASEIPVRIDVFGPAGLLVFQRPSPVGLIAWNPEYIPPLIDNRSSIAISMANFFHRKIVKDPAAGSRPVKSYELAVAGIEGLNKFLGWEMALHKNTDDKGDIRSYSFSSRLLKFNAPVKKSNNRL